MKRRHRLLLAADASVNLALGGLLLLFPTGVLGFFHLPETNTYFYTTILGAVIFGIGLALLLELWGVPRSVRGLGLGGAIAINLCGGGALLVWLVLNPNAISTRGYALLWAVAILVLGIGVAEIYARSWKYDD